MELQGAVEVVLNLRADLKLRLPDRFLLLLAAEKFQGDPGLNDRSMTGAPGRPAPSTSSEADTNSAILSAAPAAAAGLMSPESPYTSLLCGSSTSGTMSFGAACSFAAAAAPSSPALAGSGTRVSVAAGALSADSSSVTPSIPALGGSRMRVSPSLWPAGRSCVPPPAPPPTTG